MQKVEKWQNEMQGEGKKERPGGAGLDVGDQGLQLPAAEERSEDVPEREEKEMH